jgi:hypothetical protein
MRRLAAVVLCALAGASAAGAATSAPPTVTFTAPSTLAPAPTAPPQAHLTPAEATRIFEADPKVRDWLARYPLEGRSSEADYQPDRQNTWEVKIWWGKAGEVATGRVDDTTRIVTEAWTGPQVAWKMARGYNGAFGGVWMDKAWLWLALCGVFLVGLVDFRRLFSWRNLDLVALVSLSLSLLYFDKGHVLTSVPLAYPPLAYLMVRGLWVGVRGRGSPGRSVFPAWVLLAAAVFLLGFRGGLNVLHSNVIDVGYSGVIGAERISHGQAPWGNFPIEDDLKACGPADADGEIRERIQTNGRCESANPQGDTYGPAAYEAYLPGYWILGWTGKWDDLPAAHFASILWDALCVAGLFLVGRRFGGFELAAALAFAWAAYPFTLWAANSNTNDMILPAFLIWGLWLAASPLGRGVFGALAGWTKFAALIVAPLWLTYPDRRPKPRFLLGFAVATLAAFSVLLLEPSPLHEARVFWDRTFGWQLGRDSPFSIWDWGQYHARGLPNLHVVQRVLEGLLVLGALVLPFWPRTKSPLQLAALTGALLLGFELVLTHWYYGYVDWFVPFVAVTALAPRGPAREAEPVAAAEPPQLVVAS